MLFNTTNQQKRDSKTGVSFGVKAGFVLAALAGTLFLSNAADAQYRDDYRANDYYNSQYQDRQYQDRSYQPSGYETDYNRDHNLGYGSDYQSDYRSRLNRPAYGDMQGDRYSPEPSHLSGSYDRMGSRSRRGRMDQGRMDHTTRRVPQSRLDDNFSDQGRLDLNRYQQPLTDSRYRDNYNPYENAPLPQLPSTRLLGREDYRSVPRNDYQIPQNNYAPPRPAIRPTEELSEVEQIQQRLSARYGNPVVQRFVFNVSPEQTLNVYREAAQLIDARHLQPTAYNARVQRTARNLILGMQNRDFLAANRITPSANQVRSFENSMNQLLQSQPVRNQNDAVQMVYAMANVAHQQVGLRPTTVVLESIYGATETLDKYSTFLPEDPTRQPSANVLGDSVVGIGVEIKPHADGAEVIKALRGGPAESAGLQPGDLIVGINGKSIRGQNLNVAVDLIAGPVGSPVYLSVVRGGRQLSPITLTRRQVQVLSVSEVRMMGQQRNVGYIKLDKFAQSSTAEVSQALQNLQNSGMESLVFDLRGNPGGLLTTAIELSNKFLPSGTIVSTRGRNPQDNTSERATATQTWQVPLVVLVDENSASASEIFAAAIQENGRGVIVGHRSYGKGTVQTHFPLRSIGGNLKLTTAKFYSPKGREMAGAGVEPDVPVAATGYRGIASGSDEYIQAALEVAQNNRGVGNLATNQPRRLLGR